ncbi:hypothetical protein [Sulfurirhabdus autotrophica]|uniref:Uncharacterized protein n=1 Tax=Sulfurirhabdus autotrophica TaxID=1706046 RepID=A0A4R3XSQ9_9PROT|nr:hypothetical protein [Sulfurirhabdus autotrophica]TCV81276.1 hypothetical protein EDC63_12425 [Sulfurirhabdus autotrophica]
MKTRDLLIKLGFQEDWNVMTDELPGYYFDFGNAKLYAAQVMTKYLQPCILLTGVLSDNRSIGMVQSELHTYVNSYEEGMALLAYSVGEDFVPMKPTEWLDLGRKFEDHLPWVQSRKEHDARPQCVVDRDWLRVALKKLSTLIKNANDCEQASFEFDGEIFCIKFLDTRLAFPGTGKAWDSNYYVDKKNLIGLPKRLSTESVFIDISNGYLGIDGRGMSLACICEES